MNRPGEEVVGDHPVRARSFDSPDAVCAPLASGSHDEGEAARLPFWHERQILADARDDRRATVLNRFARGAAADCRQPNGGPAPPA